MPLRKRISIAAAAAAAAAVFVAVLACYAVIRGQLSGQIDNELRAQAAEIMHDGDTLTLSCSLPALTPSEGGAAQYTQVVSRSYVISSVNGSCWREAEVLPDLSQAEQIAIGEMQPTMTTVTVDGARMRMYSFADQIEINDSGAVATVAIQLARPLGGVSNILAKMRLVLVLLLLAGIALAALLGRFAARRVLSPLAQVTATAKLIGETDDLSRRLNVVSEDEVGQLAGSFNEMLTRLESSRAALDDSVRSQRQLVADASHELRTPVTSLRTNVEVMLAGPVLDDEDRKQLLTDVVEQCDELTTLVADLIEVARGDLPSAAMEDTRLDRLVEEALHRAHRNSLDTEFISELAPVALHGHPERLTRAINNLLDNAVKHNAPGQPIEVRLTPTQLTVRDHGPGLAEQDIPHVFDRFYRGIDARANQGSGLGLAIVRQVTQQHNGTAVAGNAPDGGAIFTLRIPGFAVTDDADPADELAPHDPA